MAKSACNSFANIESNCSRINSRHKIFKATSKNFSNMEVIFCEMIDTHAKTVLADRIKDSTGRRAKSRKIKLSLSGF